MALHAESPCFSRRHIATAVSGCWRFLLAVSMSVIIVADFTTGAKAGEASGGVANNVDAGAATRSTDGAVMNPGRSGERKAAVSPGLQLAHLSTRLSDLAASAEIPGQPDLYLPPVLSDGRSLAAGAEGVAEHELLVAPERIAALGSRHPIDVLLQSNSAPVVLTTREVLAALSPDAAATGFGLEDFSHADGDDLAAHDPEAERVLPADPLPVGGGTPVIRQPAPAAVVKPAPGGKTAREPVVKAPAATRQAPVKPPKPAAAKPSPSIIKPDTAVKRAVAKAAQPAPVTVRPAPAKPKMGQLEVQAVRAFSRF